MEKKVIKELFELTIIFKGHVQGVGFRYKTNYIAKKYDISGWVKNLYDGSVQVKASGTRKELIMFENDVRETFARNIESVEENFLPTYIKGRDFNIIY
ncbi:MAG: acylphosphatase [Clostridiales bacterium]